MGLLARNERAQFLCILESELHHPPLKIAGGGRELAATDSGRSPTRVGGRGGWGLGAEPRGRRQDRPAGTRTGGEEVRRRGAEGAGSVREVAAEWSAPCARIALVGLARPDYPRPELAVRDKVTAQYYSGRLHVGFFFLEKIKKHSHVN